MKKKILSLFMTLIMVLGLVGVMPVVSAGAVNDSLQNAASYTLGTIQNSSITSSVNTRVYKVVLNSSGRLNINYTGYMSCCDICVYDLNGDERYNCKYLYWNDNTKKSSLISYVDLTKGTYYFSVAKRYDSTGDFNFILSFTSAGESFTETGSGNNNSILTSNIVSLGKTYKGQIAQNDDCDIYKFTISSSGRININYTGYMSCCDIYVYDSNGEERYNCKYLYWNDNTKKSSLINSVDLTKGTYYFSVAKRLGGTGNYNFTISFTSAGESFTETGSGNNNSILTADTILLATSYKGQIAQNDDCDIYKFAMPASGRLNINYTGYMNCCDVYIYDSNGEEQYSCKYLYWNNNTKRSSLTDYVDLTKGTYYFSVAKRYGNTGNYSFKLSPTINSVSNFKVSSTSSAAVKLTWNKVSGAQGYIIYKYDNSKKTWVRVAKTKTTANTYTVSKLASGTSYKFAVKAYKTVNGKEITSSSFPTVTAITKLPTVVNGTTTVGKNSVKLTWKKTTGATGYIVYKYDNSKKTWVRVAKTGSLNYLVKNLKSNTNYKFAVKAYKKVSGKEITSVSYKTISVKTKK